MKKKLVVYGASGTAKDVVCSLDADQYEIVGMIDDASAVQGYNEWSGTEVRPSERLNEWEYDYVIISSPWHYTSMMSHLNALGVSEEKIVVWKPVNKITCLDQRVAYLRLCMDQIKEKNIEGACAELGVYKGDFSKHINRYLPDRKLYLFDTFEGFGEQNVLDIEREKMRKNALNGFQDTTVAEVLEKMDHPDQCIVCKGFFPQTAENIDEKFALVSLDADLHETIKSGLEYFYPRLSSGGYLFVHDYGEYAWPGVKVAVDEYCRQHHIPIFPILDMCLSAVIIKQ